MGLLERRWPQESYPVREHSDYKKEVKLEAELCGGMLRQCRRNKAIMPEGRAGDKQRR